MDRENNNPGVLGDPDINARVDTLMAKMTLAQKIGQMVQTERMAITPAEVRSWHIGSVLSGGGSCPGDNEVSDWVATNDAYWQAAMDADESHLAIPILYGVDAIHGHNNVSGATIFPHNIGLGATGDLDLLEKIARITAREILATGLDWTFAPTLAVAQNIQWGRTYESYSENPEMVSAYAGRFVRGLQGDLGDESIIACIKHWVGDGGTNHGIDQGNTTVSEHELERLHIAPYREAIEAGALTVMVSFNSWQGEKCHGNAYLIDYLLKNRLRFDGMVISDWDGIDYLADNYSAAVAAGVKSGIDMFMVSQHWQPFIRHLSHHVIRGDVPMSRIDDAVRRILRVKFACGLFDKPRPAARRWSGDASFGCPEHRAVARQAVRQSLVLLKNDAALLPLDRQQRILVAGKNAHNLGAQCGGFTVTWQGLSGNELVVGGTSIWEGIQALAPRATLSADASGAEADPRLHDAAIVVIGEKPYAEGMGDIRTGDDVIVQAGSQINGFLKVLEPYGSTMQLAELHPEDLETITRIAATGVPVVTVLISGRPLVTTREMAASSAFVAAWLPGSEGQGVADVLFGEHPFTGKLSFSWPASHARTMDTGADGYDRLFGCGYGLSY